MAEVFTMPMFSVLIPSHNRADLLERALASVFAQTYKDYEIIVVDDGSTDDTLERLDRYGDTLKVLSQPNRGPGAARNLGAGAARGEYLVFLDSDDLLFPWTLERYARLVRDHRAPALVLGAPVKFACESELEVLASEPLDATFWDDYLMAAGARYPVSIAAAVKAEAFRAVGGFFDHHQCAEDQDLFLRLGEAKGFVFARRPNLYAYRQHPVSISRDSERFYRGAAFMLERERQGGYPGGRARRSERSVLLARKLRYSISRCLEGGHRARALELYRRGWPLLLRAGYTRDLLRLPLTIHRQRRRSPSPAPPASARRPV